MTNGWSIWQLKIAGHMDFKSIVLILFNLGQTMDSDDYGPCVQDRQTVRLVRPPGMMGQNSEFWKNVYFGF